MPALAIFKELRLKKQQNTSLEIIYIGRHRGIERNIFERQVDVYIPVSAEKWRRYFSFRNFLTGFIAVQAFFQALKCLYPYRKRALFMHTGGYVGLMPALAAALLRIPVYLHEQTSRAGLANKIAAPFAKRIFISFKSSAPFFPAKKTLWTGYPISKLFYSEGKSQRMGAEAAVEFLDKVPDKQPLLLITGGSNGSAFINAQVKADLAELCRHYFVFHQVGRAHLDQFMSLTSDSYLPVGLISPAEWAYIMRRAEIIVARAGAGTVSECIYLNKRVLFFPLAIAQRQEQLCNAREAENFLTCKIVPEKAAHTKTLSAHVRELAALPAVSTVENADYKDFKRKLTSAARFITNSLIVDPNVPVDHPLSAPGEPAFARTRTATGSRSGLRKRGGRRVAAARRSQQPAARHSQPAARHSQPAARHSQPAARHSQPARTRTAVPDKIEATVAADGTKYIENPFRSHRPAGQQTNKRSRSTYERKAS